MASTHAATFFKREASDPRGPSEDKSKDRSRKSRSINGQEKHGEIQRLSGSLYLLAWELACWVFSHSSRPDQEMLFKKGTQIELKNECRRGSAYVHRVVDGKSRSCPHCP